MRRAARTDANHTEIVRALREHGCFVQSLAAIGDGCPDLLIGAAGNTALLELKDGTRPPSEQRLTVAQQLWHAAWRGGTLAIVNDIEGALRVARMLHK